MKLITSRMFNKDVSTAKRLARFEPVFVTYRGKPTHVLLGIDAFKKLAGQGETLVDLLAMDEFVAIEPDWRAASGHRPTRAG